MEEPPSDPCHDLKTDETHLKPELLKSSAKLNSDCGKVGGDLCESGMNSIDELTSTTNEGENLSNVKQNEAVPMQADATVCGMRKEDSGIYSEKSPNCANLKESDGELSESISESFDDNGMEDIGADVDKGLETNKNNNIVANSKTIGDENPLDLVSKSDSEVVEKVANSDLSIVKAEAGTSLNSDIETSTDVAMEGTSDGVDTGSENIPDGSGDKSKIEAICDDDDDISQNEDETWAKFIRKSVKIRSKARKLVDYEDSDDVDSVDSNADSRPLGHRSYRKRKSDSDSESNDANSEADTNRDVNAEHNVEEEDNVDSTPVLLRHSALGSDLDVDSDSDDSEQADADDMKDGDADSMSDGEESPVDISRFGPPKHKWRALFDLRQRELGYSVYKEPSNFRIGVQGSLQMVKRFDIQFKMDHHEGCVNALHFNSIGTLLASGSDDLNIVIWDWLKNSPALVYDSGHRSNVFQSKFMPFSGDAHVVSCARDGQIRLADLSSTGVCKGTKKIAQHRGAAHKLALEMDSPHVLLSCGEDAVTFEIDLRSDKPNRLVTTKEDDKKVAMYSIHSNPVNSNEFCLGGRDHFIRVYDKRNINEAVNDGLVKKFSPHHIASAEKNEMKANVTCACYNYNGTEILGTYNDEDIYLFNNEHSDSADYVHRYSGHRNNQTVKGVNFYGPRSEFVVSGSDCGHIFLWDKDTENIVQYLEGDEGGVINVLEPHPFAPVLATSGLDHDVKIWAPTLSSPTKLKGLKKIIKQNKKERDEERSGDGAMVDGSMLWFIMHQLRRSRRRREREARAARGDADEDDTSDTLSDDDTTPSGSEDSDDGGPQDRLQCATS